MNRAASGRFRSRRSHRPLVGWGKLVDGRSFVITEDLCGYRDAEKMVARRAGI